ncbi:MAG: F0F1 ATP synthase subunit A [Holosporaceae bacterium]|jgi:F-type H+-transporting ATPase subunit a|nr:F0F1 ATP synthase subunit A [Holosporaceae bacterium]
MQDPLHQFVIHPYFRILKIGGIELSFTNSSLAVVMDIVLICVLMSMAIGGRKLIPGRLQALAEIFHRFIANLVEDNIGPRGQKYFPFVFSVFLFVLFGNLLGMIPGAFTFTSHIVATFTLAMIVFLSVTVVGFRRHGLKYFGILAPGGVSGGLLFFLVPIELISYLSRPISLAIRLFANMMAGHTMMKVFAGFAVMLSSSDAGSFSRAANVIPLAANVMLTGFEIAVALLQAYVFAILTCVYMNDAVNLHH